MGLGNKLITFTCGFTAFVAMAWYMTPSDEVKIEKLRQHNRLSPAQEKQFQAMKIKAAEQNRQRALNVEKKN